MLGETTIDSIIHSGPWLPAGIAVALLVWVYARIRKKQGGPQKFGSGAGSQSAAKAGGRNSGTARESNSISPGELRTVAGELNSLLVELHETARRLAAQMDNRASRLDALLAEADEKIKRLEAFQARLEGSGGEQAPADAPAQRTSAVAEDHVEDPKYRKIYDLADRGHSSREIAAQVGAQPGEVELILNLRAKPADG